jgi:hypothetical protein
VMINVGEGIHRAPDLLEKMIYTTESVATIGECQPFRRSDYRKMLYQPFLPE